MTHYRLSILYLPLTDLQVTQAALSAQNSPSRKNYSMVEDIRMQSLFEFFDRLLTSDYLEYAVGGVVVLVWWIISKTRYTLRSLRGDTEVHQPQIDEQRPRRRIPLY